MGMGGRRGLARWAHEDGDTEQRRATADVSAVSTSSSVQRQRTCTRPRGLCPGRCQLAAPFDSYRLAVGVGEPFGWGESHPDVTPVGDPVSQSRGAYDRHVAPSQFLSLRTRVWQEPRPTSLGRTFIR